MNGDLVSLMLQRQAYIRQCQEQLPQTRYCLFPFINSILSVMAEPRHRTKDSYNKVGYHQLQIRHNPESEARKKLQFIDLGKR